MMTTFSSLRPTQKLPQQQNIRFSGQYTLPESPQETDTVSFDGDTYTIKQSISGDLDAKEKKVSVQQGVTINGKISNANIVINNGNVNGHVTARELWMYNNSLVQSAEISGETNLDGGAIIENKLKTKRLGSAGHNTVGSLEITSGMNTNGVDRDSNYLLTVKNGLTVTGDNSHLQIYDLSLGGQLLVNAQHVNITLGRRAEHLREKIRAEANASFEVDRA